MSLAWLAISTLPSASLQCRSAYGICRNKKELNINRNFTHLINLFSWHGLLILTVLVSLSIIIDKVRKGKACCCKERLSWHVNKNSQTAKRFKFPAVVPPGSFGQALSCHFIAIAVAVTMAITATPTLSAPSFVLVQVHGIYSVSDNDRKKRHHGAALGLEQPRKNYCCSQCGTVITSKLCASTFPNARLLFSGQ